MHLFLTVFSIWNLRKRLLSAGQLNEDVSLVWAEISSCGIFSINFNSLKHLRAYCSLTHSRGNMCFWTTKCFIWLRSSSSFLFLRSKNGLAFSPVDASWWLLAEAELHLLPELGHSSLFLPELAEMSCLMPFSLICLWKCSSFSFLSWDTDNNLVYLQITEWALWQKWVPLNCSFG